MYRNPKIIIALALVLSSCSVARAPVPTAPPPPPASVQLTEAQAWSKAVDYFGVIEESRHAANQFALTLSRQNKIPVSVLDSFVKIDGWAIQANKLLQGSPNVFNQSISTQVILLANQILLELTQYNSAAKAYPELSTPLMKMESAATSIKGLK